VRIALLACALLAACGKPPPADGAARLALLASERGQGVLPPPGPAWHFRALGRVIFPSEPAPLQQEAELWIGGPDRIKFVMTAADGGGRNVFLLDGGAGCWVRTDAEPWREWGSTELLAESEVRWALLRFPWGWEAEVRAAPEAAEFRRATGSGELTLEIGADGLPRAASCSGVRAEVSDWRVLSHGARTAPFRWAWTGPSGRRAEEYDELREDARFFDEAFRPPPAAGAGPARIAGGAVERFGLIQARLWRVEGAAPESAMNEPSWWRHEGRRVAAVLLEPGAPAPESADGAAPEAAGGEWWLRWSFVGLAADAAQTEAELLSAAEQAGLSVLGRPWVRETPDDGRAHGQIALVAVAPPAAQQR